MMALSLRMLWLCPLLCAPEQFASSAWHHPLYTVQATSNKLREQTAV